MWCHTGAETEEAYALELKKKVLDEHLPILLHEDADFHVPAEMREQGYQVTSDVVDFINALYREELLPNIHVNREDIAEARRIWADPEELARADLCSLAKILAVEAEAGRFVGGQMAWLFEEGHMPRVLARIEEVVEEIMEERRARRSLWRFVPGSARWRERTGRAAS